MKVSIPKKITYPAKLADAGKMILIAALSHTQAFGVYPFGIAYAAKVYGENPVPALLGLALGMIGKNTEFIAKYSACLLIYAVIIHVRRFEDSSVKAVALGASLTAATVLSFFGTSVTVAKLIMILPEAFAAGGLYKLFGSAGEDGITAFFAEILLLGGCLGGFYYVKLPYTDLSVAVLAAALVTMSVCHCCEIPAASFTGAIMGFMLMIEYPEAIEMTGIFTVSAFFSAILSGMGKAGTAAGFLCGMTVSVLFTGHLGKLSVSDIFVPPLIFAVLPESLTVRLGSGINKKFGTGGYSLQREELSETLKTVARAVNDLGNGVKIFSGAGMQGESIYIPVVERVCADCRCREECFGDGRENTCVNFGLLFEAMERDGTLGYENLPENFECIKTERIINEISHIYELRKQDAVHSGESGEDRNIMAKQYGELSNIINVISDTVVKAPRTGKIAYTVSAATCSEPKKGQEISGDTVIHFSVGSKYYVILCDGMGSGMAAREISGLTARLFAEFFSAGIDKESAVNMINSALALNADRESFSSADILEIDMETGDAEFLKVGSAQSFLKSGNGIAEIPSDALPIGILDSVSAKPKRYRLSENDIVVMISDGVGEAGNGVMKSEWIKKLLFEHKKNDNELAMQLVKGAKARASYSDDMTSAVIRIKRTEETK